jgi:predicted transcriptional regulator
MSFMEKVDKLIKEAAAKYQKLDAQRKQLQEDKAILDQNIARTIEEELRVVGELRALETVKKESVEPPAPPEPTVPSQEH